MIWVWNNVYRGVEKSWRGYERWWWIWRITLRMRLWVDLSMSMWGVDGEWRSLLFRWTSCRLSLYAKGSTAQTHIILFCIFSTRYTSTFTCSKNEHELCGFWSSLGECETNRGFMLSHCAAACRLCLLQATNMMAWTKKVWQCSVWRAAKVILVSMVRATMCKTMRDAIRMKYAWCEICFPVEACFQKWENKCCNGIALTL